MQRDKNGHRYCEVENIRITYVPATDRSPNADWSGHDVIRIQAYRGNRDKSLHRGAELPISSPEILETLFAAIRQVYNVGRAGRNE